MPTTEGDEKNTGTARVKKQEGLEVPLYKVHDIEDKLKTRHKICAFLEKLFPFHVSRLTRREKCLEN